MKTKLTRLPLIGKSNLRRTASCKQYPKLPPKEIASIIEKEYLSWAKQLSL